MISPNPDKIITMGMPLEEDENSLSHHGVKGQKWGIRRTRDQLGYKDRPRKRRTAKMALLRLKRRLERAKKNRQEKQKANEAKRQARIQAQAKQKREEILKNPRALNRYKKQFTRQELEEAAKRFEAEKKIAIAAADSIAGPRRWLDEGSKYINVAANIMQNMERAMNAYEKLNADDNKKK